MQDLASEFSKIFRGSYSRTLTRPGVGTRTVGPLNFSAVVAQGEDRMGRKEKALPQYDLHGSITIAIPPMARADLEFMLLNTS